MALSKYTADELRAARKAGFRSKCPKRPKMNAGVSALENYIARHNDWVKRMKSAKSSETKKTALRKSIFGR